MNDPLILIEKLPLDRNFATLPTPQDHADVAALSGSRREESLAWRALVRSAVGAQVRIGYDAAGAPMLEGEGACCISVSHCRDYVAVCLRQQRCGIDVERLDRDFERVRSRYIHPQEELLCDDARLPAVVWCAKEALYKYAGRSGVDFLRDLRIERLDPEGGTLLGRIAERRIAMQLRFFDRHVAVWTV